VVGDQQAAGCDGLPVLLEADAEDLQQPGGPALLQADLPGWRDEGKAEGRDRQAEQQVRGEAGVAEQADGGGGGAGGFQSLRPMKCLA
jgi:hypothetical protein